MGKGGRPTIDVSVYRDEIVRRAKAGENQAAIGQWLKDEHNISISVRTLRRNLTDWGVYLRKNAEITEQLRLRLTVLFFQGCLNDRKIVEILTSEGFVIEQRRLAKLRKEMGLNKRIKPEVKTEDEDTRVESLLKTIFADPSELRKHNKHSLYAHVRAKGYIASRDRLCKLLKQAKDEAKAVNERDKQNQQHTDEVQDPYQQPEQQQTLLHHQPYQYHPQHPLPDIDPRLQS